MSQAAEPTPSPRGSPAPHTAIPPPAAQTGMIVGIIAIVVGMIGLPTIFCCYIGPPIMMTAVGLALAAYLHPDRSGKVTGIIGLILGAFQFIFFSAMVVFLLVMIAIDSRSARTSATTSAPTTTAPVSGTSVAPADGTAPAGDQSGQQ